MRGNNSVNVLPSAGGAIARAAYELVLDARLDAAPLLKAADLTTQQAKNGHVRVAARNQIKFLNSAADAMRDEFLGVQNSRKLWICASLDCSIMFWRRPKPLAMRYREWRDIAGFITKQLTSHIVAVSASAP